MNQNQIQQLTLHLSQALDQNYDVVNMETVLSVISALEGTTITKEQLEATRLAKYINQLRRRTTNDSLARRAKSLLKKWREMVGIQQTTHDSQPLQAQQSFKPIVNNISSSESAIADTTVDRVPSVISSVSDSTELTNFSNLIRHINIESSNDSIVNKTIRNQQTVVNKPVPFINEHSVNSVCNEPSIVIDIVTDSDDNNEQPDQLSKFTPSSSSSYPTLFSRNQTKKIKKDKKHREREREARARPSSFLQQQQQSSRYNGFTDSKVPTDSEILSLSNSSMSSILSVEVISGNSQSQGKFRATNITTTPDLTFAGRFKSVINNRLDNSILPTIDQKDAPESSNKKIMNDEIVNNDDTSTSCSRLSAFEEEQQQPEMSALKPSYEKEKGAEEGDKPLSQVPKKRGRKKGSKGVDSIIGKKESSLSQQIFFGSTAGAGVKKVKTTKELFNEIQSRKLSISFNRSETSTGIIDKSSNHNVQTRPASSCSETSVNSPLTLETYASTKSTLDDVVNTDSDTVSSERQTSLSFDSNSNYSNLQNLSVRNNIDVPPLDHNNVDNVKTQLMHLVHSFSTPLSITDTERLYESQLVPCTCHVVEEVSKVKEPEESDSEVAVNQTISKDIAQGNSGNSNQLATQTKIAHSNESKNPLEEISALSLKPVKSIFDLDFDDDVDDALSSIVKDVIVPQNNNCSSMNRVDNVDMSIPAVSTESNSCLNIQLSYHEENNEVSDDVIESVTSSLYTVHEDPDCPAKKRFNVQTMDVTGFHINALHNYYVPNINGNWNNIDMLSLKPYATISEFLKKLETYSVSDGADVVPKYGSLTYGRIRKDLTSHKFAKCFKPRTLKSSMIPFLGIAKCLLSCRREAKRQRYIVKQKSTKLSTKLTIKDNPSPLSVDVSEHVDIFGESQSQLQYRFDQDTYNSRNLLKMSEESIEGTMQTINSRHHKGRNSINSITKSCFSLQYKEGRKRSMHTKRTLVERNRKKRRKEQVKGQEPRIKRIKIALNGNVAIQRQISHSSEDGEENEEKIKDEVQSDAELSDTENESSRCLDTEPSNDENDTNVEEEYAIVQRPLLSGNNNHLVLTIKKTPSKINSPINPEADSIIKPIKTSNNQSNSISSYGQRNQCIMGVRDLHKYSRYPRRRRIRNGHSNRFRDQKYSFRHDETIDLELKHLFRNNNNLNPRPTLKTHQKLFFMNELNTVDSSGETERIINYSSSSDESERELDENNIEKEKKDILWPGELDNTTDHQMKIIVETRTETEASAAAINEETQDMQNTADSYLSSSDDASVNMHDSVNDSENDTALFNMSDDSRLHNNGMLPSFNFIDENCGDEQKSICYDKLNYNLDSCYSFEKNLEYRSGIRNVANGDEPEDCAQIQQFREWHEILQLKSYNNEPLVVLPYVVLE